MKSPSARLALPAPLTIVLAGADAGQVAAFSAALERALATQEAAGLPPVRLHPLLHPDAAADVARARQALLITSAGDPALQQIEGRLRDRLAGMQLPYAIVPPLPPGLERALGALRAALRQPPAGPRWRWVCPNCDDGECEAHALQGAGAARPAA